jgi:hypothetical protein
MTMDGTTEEPTEEPTDVQGTGIIAASWIGTGIFVAVALVATVSPDGFGVAAATVSLALFAAGCVVFLWAYLIAVQRSRVDLIGIGGLYFLQGTAPRIVQFRLLGSLAVQVAVALVTSSIRLYSPLAFGFLVPVYGLAMCGLWGARVGTFERRAVAE